jgi:hypothetical protein
MTVERTRRITKHIHEGLYAADVEITLIYDGSGWDPGIGPADVEKLDRVARALRRGDVATAAKEAKVFELMPLAGE